MNVLRWSRQITAIAIIVSVSSFSQAAVMTSVSTLDGGTGLPFPGSGDMDFGVTSSSSMSAGNQNGSAYSGTASANHTTFTDGLFLIESFQFKLFSQAINPAGAHGGPEAFEVEARANWSDTITGVTGDVILLPNDLLLVFRIHSVVDIVDTLGVGTVSQDFQANVDFDPPNPPATVGVTTDNSDGGPNEYSDVTLGGGQLNGFTTVAPNEYTAIVKVPVKRGVQFHASFHTLSVVGNDGSSTANMLSTVSLIDITNSSETQSFQNVEFDDTNVTFSANAVPEPSSWALMGLAGLGLFVRRYRRNR